MKYPVLSRHSKKDQKLVFMTDNRLMQDKVLQNAPREHSTILLTFIKLQFVINTLVLSIFEWPLKTGFTVLVKTFEPVSMYLAFTESYLVSNQ